MNSIEYEVLAKDVEDIANGFANCCKKGCAFCCYQMIEVYDFEKESIIMGLRKLSKEIRDEIRVNLDKWFDFFNANTPENKILDEHDTIQNFINISLTKKEKCPLLINNQCSIYANRPLTCRIHSVESSPGKCEADPYRQSSPKSNNLRSHMIQYIIELNLNKSELLFLPFLIAEEIKTNKKIKPLKKLYI
ncbi:YkgJ family cysteine cluster protein [Elizabethkingia meningoseptica]|uniref:YkgJ family cysteine cluster protein n=1 Tax=Elizabethkingia meningoseptica TaxID=238 RepID=UPI0023B113A0|nr:YkgJ family cysteine cluster protein [Elizabethkingia meningoseptica]MDE5480469.1 YkgJ family cysteine cluster protein [Elizabethkingia meningoseptica]